VKFSNVQKIKVTSSRFFQDIAQQTSVTSQTITGKRGHAVTTQATLTWPFTLDYDYVVNGSSSATQTAAVVQTKNEADLVHGSPSSNSASVLNTVQSSDTLTFTPSGFTPSHGKSRQQYKSLDLQGQCYDKIIKSLEYVLTGVVKGC
jgi:hypothetical protein